MTQHDDEVIFHSLVDLLGIGLIASDGFHAVRIAMRKIINSYLTISPSLPPSFPPSLLPSLPSSLPPSLPSSLPPSLPSSLPPSLPITIAKLKAQELGEGPGEEGGAKGKSQLELLKEQRDYKRRRQTYRAKNVHITRRTPAQVCLPVCWSVCLSVCPSVCMYVLRS